MRGYDRKSLVVLLVLGAVGAFAAIVWSEYVSFKDADALLVVCWVLMAVLMAHRVDPVRDGRLALVAFAGGAFIESWGTRSGLWTYFTHEQPPLFILPAWPAAALATERIAHATELHLKRIHISARAWSVAFAAVMLAFVALLWVRTTPAHGHALSWAAAAFILVTIFTGDDRRSDLARFFAGSLLGYLLERWGTTSECWTYWTAGAPPLWSVLAHGMATVAFARGAAALARAMKPLAHDCAGRSREAAS